MASFGRARRAPGPSSALGRPFIALLAASLLLLLARDTAVVRGVSTFATELLVPVERVLGQIGAPVGRAWQAIAEIETLRSDNESLRTQVDRLTLDNVQLTEQLIAAQQAAKLGATAAALPFKTVQAPVVAADPSGVVHSIVLGVGTGDGVHLDDIVVSETGVVGRVSEVGANYSKVVLVTDSASTVSALVQGSRAAGIVRGQFGDTLVMDWILQTEDVKIGDIVITAGLAIGGDVRSLYPKGLVLGKVVEVTKGDTGTFQRAILVPAVDLRHLENVLVVHTAS
ncbi:MAG: rod shape-determining protein MreC [Chloroflexi bacterium]|nr:MAG: rod shape-determining protein MreC [Chloroflexota bacterium]TMG68971.1 MAG: rod shape-determining protein MreC [Chloroflexota bacterium]